MDACIQAHIPAGGFVKPAEPAVEILETGEVVEIEALSEDLTQEALYLIQERQERANPMRVLTKQLKCSALPAEQTEIQRRGSKESQKSSPGLAIASKMKAVFPPLSWFPDLNRWKVRADVIAGITVGVMVIPQGMSYASIAGLPYIYGMYSACVPTFTYALFGQSRQLAVGPVAMVSLLVEAGLSDAQDPTCGSECESRYVALAILTSLAVGLMQLLASLMRLGFLVSFLGHPVTSGFTSAAAIIIGLSQVKYIVGYDIEKSQYIHVTVEAIFSNIGELNVTTLALGIGSIAFLMLTRKVARKFPRVSLLGPLGPLILCILGILLLITVPSLETDQHVKAVGAIPGGLMPISVQLWDFSNFVTVLPTAMSACLIGYMESIAIGKNLAAKNGYEIEAGQELFALGMANLVGACFSCYPVTGSFSRSAVNQMTGACTQLAGMVTSVMMLLTLLLLTPLFQELPKFVLAAIVINSVIPLVAYEEALKLFKVKKEDALLWFVAFIGTLFLGVLMGIFLAVLLSLIIVIYESVRPQITVLWRIPGTTIYRNMKQEQSGAFIPNVFICRIGSSMYFANASYIKDVLMQHVADMEPVNKIEYIVLEMTPVISLDSTAVHVLHDIVADFRARHIQVAFALVGNRAERTMQKAGIRDFIGERWFFQSVNDAVYYCLRHQYARKRRRASQDGDVELGSQVSGVMKDEDIMHDDKTIVRTTDEIGFSNDIHHDCTTLFITLVRDVPGFMSEVTKVFRKHQLNVVRALVEPIDDTGAKHTYFVKSNKTDGKLSEYEVKRLREDLGSVMSRITKAKKYNGAQSVSVDPFSNNADLRMQQLTKTCEESIAEDRKMREQIMEQTKLLQRVLAGLGGVQLEDVVVQMESAERALESSKKEKYVSEASEVPRLAMDSVASKGSSSPACAENADAQKAQVQSEPLITSQRPSQGFACFGGLDYSSWANQRRQERTDGHCLSRSAQGWKRAQSSGSSACYRGLAARPVPGICVRPPAAATAGAASSRGEGCLKPLTLYRPKVGGSCLKPAVLGVTSEALEARSALREAAEAEGHQPLETVETPQPLETTETPQNPQGEGSDTQGTESTTAERTSGESPPDIASPPEVETPPRDGSPHDNGAGAFSTRS